MTRSREHGMQLVMTAAWFALATGLAEAAILGVRDLLAVPIQFTNPQGIWMGPIAYLPLFVGAACAVLLASRWWQALAAPRVQVSLFAFLGWIGILLHFWPRLHKLAVLILAVGLGLQTGRLASGAVAARLVRRSVIALAAIVVAIGVGMNAARAVIERRAVASLPAAAAGAPNVLLIVWDVVRAGSVSLYGAARPTTPMLERLAREGVVFERAIAPAPWTTPTHATLFTAYWPHELSDNWFPPRPFPDRPTLASVLRGKGYMTAGFVANVEYTSRETGLARGFDQYEDYRISPGEFVLSTSLGRFVAMSPRLRRWIGHADILGRKTATDVTNAFLDWLERVDGRPFFAFLNYFDAHEPYLPPPPFDTLFGPVREERERHIAHVSARQAKRTDKEVMTRGEVAAELEAYEEAIAYLDSELDRLMRALEARGVLDNTLVIVTADHGEHFGEHGLFGHGQALYRPSLRVPLVLMNARHLPAGVRVPQVVSLRDLPATIVDVLGVTGVRPFPGASLRSLWEGGRATAPRSPAYSELNHNPTAPQEQPVSRGEMRSLVSGRWHYIRNGDGVEELYDLERDPGALRDVADSAGVRAVLDSLRDEAARIAASGGNRGV